MSLELDKRQRAMLREMGVRVWLPQAASHLPTLAATATAPLQAPAAEMPAVVLAQKPREAGNLQVGTATGAAVQTRPTSAQIVQPPQHEERARIAGTSGATGDAWSVGTALRLYTQADPTKGARWLVLTETTAAVQQLESFNPLEGDAGKLLDNMLRALRLHTQGTVMLAPLLRRMASGISPEQAPASIALPTLLANLVAEIQPDVVLLMGRLASQALLQSSDPFGKLRGQIHSWHNTKTIVTHDAQYLLRTPSEKAKVWDDLCLALSAVAT